jgi:hypothetical protein
MRFDSTSIDEQAGRVSVARLHNQFPAKTSLNEN